MKRIYLGLATLLGSLLLVSTGSALEKGTQVRLVGQTELYDMTLMRNEGNQAIVRSPVHLVEIPVVSTDLLVAEGCTKVADQDVCVGDRIAVFVGRDLVASGGRFRAFSDTLVQFESGTFGLVEQRLKSEITIKKLPKRILN